MTDDERENSELPANDGEEKQQRTVQSFDTMRDHEEVKETNQHSHDHNDKFHINNDAFERFTLEMDLEMKQNKVETTDTFVFIKKILLEKKVFCDIHDGLDEMIQQMYRVRVEKGQCILKEGDILTRFFVIQSGSLGVVYQQLKGAEPALLHTLKAGQSFGEACLLFHEQKARSTATLIANEHITLWALDAHVFYDLTSTGNTDETTEKDDETAPLNPLVKQKREILQDKSDCISCTCTIF